VLFNVWLKKQGDDEVSITAIWAMGSAEIQIGQTVAALRGLAERRSTPACPCISTRCGRRRCGPGRSRN
jgi:hypothetical protein